MGLTLRFTDHPRSVDETYGEHFLVALRFSGHLAIASMKAAVHAFLPWLCCTSASRKVAELNREMTSGARAAVAGDAADQQVEPSLEQASVA